VIEPIRIGERIKRILQRVEQIKRRFGFCFEEELRRCTLSSIIKEKGRRYNIDPKLLEAIIKVESNFNPFAVSPKGAMGLMQLLPSTAKRVGVENVFDVEENVEGGAKYLRTLLDRFGSLELALAAYNAGEGAVQQYGGIPPFKETQDYVNKVLRIYRRE
jgi:soluble lytic murein transglycosylase-like protein